jgi:ABC-type hemin transport system ATPase subunit
MNSRVSRNRKRSGGPFSRRTLARAAEQGARRALADVGLDGPEAAIDIHDLRTLLDSLRMARRTAWQTIVRLITTGLLLALIAGIAVKLKLFG